MSKPSDLHKDITWLTSTSSSELLEQYDTWVFDCDGVLWEAGKPFESSIRLVAELQKLGKNIFFITNNSTKSRQQYAAKMKTNGFGDISPDIVYCASSLAGIFLARHHPDVKKAYVIGESGLDAELRANGIEVVRDSKEASPEMTETEMGSYDLNKDVDAVVCGWDKAVSFRKLSIATLYLRNQHRRNDDNSVDGNPCLFLATNRDTYDRVSSSRVIPGNGPTISYLENATSVQALQSGKPNPWSVNMIVAEHKLDKKSMIMIGDRLDTDMLLAKNSGISSLCVMTGVSSTRDISQKHCEIVPTFAASSLDGVWLEAILN